MSDSWDFITKAAIDDPNWVSRTTIMRTEKKYNIQDLSLHAPQQAKNAIMKMTAPRTMKRMGMLMKVLSRKVMKSWDLTLRKTPRQMMRRPAAAKRRLKMKTVYLTQLSLHVFMMMKMKQLKLSTVSSSFLSFVVFKISIFSILKQATCLQRNKYFEYQMWW